MTTPVPVPALPDPAQPNPDSVVSESPVTITFEAISAARAELDQAALDAKAGLWSRVLRTLTQGAIAAGVLAAVGAVSDATGHGVFNWQTLVFSAGQAAITAVVAYAHNKAVPATK